MARQGELHSSICNGGGQRMQFEQRRLHCLLLKETRPLPRRFGSTDCSPSDMSRSLVRSATRIAFIGVLALFHCHSPGAPAAVVGASRLAVPPPEAVDDGSIKTVIFSKTYYGNSEGDQAKAESGTDWLAEYEEHRQKVNSIKAKNFARRTTADLIPSREAARHHHRRRHAAPSLASYLFSTSPIGRARRHRHERQCKCGALMQRHPDGRYRHPKLGAPLGRWRSGGLQGHALYQRS